MASAKVKRCGPQHGDVKCEGHGECCSDEGLCGAGPEFCTSSSSSSSSPQLLRRHMSYDAQPRVSCDPKPMGKLWTACQEAEASEGRAAPPRCGPAHHAMCPWRTGEDLCCVQDPGSSRQGDGVCVRCDLVQPSEDVFIWRADGSSGKWSAVRGG